MLEVSTLLWIQKIILHNSQTDDVTRYEKTDHLL